MVRRVGESIDGEVFRAAIDVARKARRVAALTGAGISTDCGIPDFRGATGLWSVYDPIEYATLDAFLADPAKAWGFYRALGATLQGKSPGPAHRALARLEMEGALAGVVTQNIDGLHQAAGSRQVAEVHGECRNLQCIRCGFLEAVGDRAEEDIPRCPGCGFALKPNVVLFGELVREMGLVDELLDRCDLLLVIGTSAEVHPVANLPFRVLSNGGAVIEFNLEPTALTSNCHFFFAGRAGQSVVRFAEGWLATT